MRRFLLLILAEIERNPNYNAEQLAHELSFPVSIMRKSLKELYEESIILPRKSEFYITFLGRIALNKYDVEKAQNSLDLRREALQVICTALHIHPDDIEHFSPTELGMTNRSFLLRAKGQEYIFRTPGEGTDQLVDRYREYRNYLALEGKGLSDVVIYHNPLTGVKITKYIHGCRMPDKTDPKDLKLCFTALKKMHETAIVVDHRFDFSERIRYYEQLCEQENCIFLPGYAPQRLVALNLLALLQKMPQTECFCHIDSVPGNFLVAQDNKVTLIDWEYAGMCDPLADVAMWCLSAQYTKPECDRALRIYIDGKPNENELNRFYSYLSLGGLMWNLWAEYKASLGESYGDYAAKMFGYSKHYAALVFKRTQQ